MPLRPYPKELPPEALALTFQAFSGQPVNRNEAIWAAYEVAGFAAGKIFPPGPLVVGDSPVVLVSDAVTQSTPPSVDEAAEAFNVASHTIGSPEVIDGQQVAQLSPLVVQLLLRVAIEVFSRLK